MKRMLRGGSGTLILLTAWLVLSLAWSAAGAEPVDYGKDVKAVLKSRCIACHGARGQALMQQLFPHLQLSGPPLPAAGRGAGGEGLS